MGYTEVVSVLLQLLSLTYTKLQEIRKVKPEEIAYLIKIVCTEIDPFLAQKIIEPALEDVK